MQSSVFDDNYNRYVINCKENPRVFPGSRALWVMNAELRMQWHKVSSHLFFSNTLFLHHAVCRYVIFMLRILMHEYRYCFIFTCRSCIYIYIYIYIVRSPSSFFPHMSRTQWCLGLPSAETALSAKLDVRHLRFFWLFGETCVDPMTSFNIANDIWPNLVAHRTLIFHFSYADPFLDTFSDDINLTFTRLC